MLLITIYLCYAYLFKTFLFEGCYSDSVELIPTVVKKTMMISSVGMCQELCYHENSYKFALKVGIAHDIT